MKCSDLCTMSIVANGFFLLAFIGVLLSHDYCIIKDSLKPAKVSVQLTQQQLDSYNKCVATASYDAVPFCSKGE